MKSIDVDKTLFLRLLRLEFEEECMPLCPFALESVEMVNSCMEYEECQKCSYFQEYCERKHRMIATIKDNKDHNNFS